MPTRKFFTAFIKKVQKWQIPQLINKSCFDEPRFKKAFGEALTIILEAGGIMAACKSHELQARI
jgi:hypothetical protein